MIYIINSLTITEVKYINAKLSELSHLLCEDCQCKLRKYATDKNLEEDIAYFLTAISVCNNCWSKLLDNEKIPHTKYTIGDTVVRQGDALWQNTEIFI